MLNTCPDASGPLLAFHMSTTNVGLSLSDTNKVNQWYINLCHQQIGILIAGGNYLKNVQRYLVNQVARKCSQIVLFHPVTCHQPQYNGTTR